MKRFEGRVVVITGAGSGMGEAAARLFSAEGASVVLGGNTRSKLERVAGALPPERTLVHEVDVSRPEQVDAFVAAAAERFGRIDVLVNSAGVDQPGTAEEVTTEEWLRVMNTDAGGTFYACRAALPHLKKTRGNIINVSSVSGLGGDWSHAAYNASKGAVSMLTQCLALDHGKDGVRVNAVCPSLTLTPMTETIKHDEEKLAKFRERIPLGRPAEPDDIARAMLLLASDDAAYITGVLLPVDGGLSASNGQPPLG